MSRTHYLNSEILHAITSDDEVIGRAATMRTSQRRIPLTVNNQARTRRTPEFISLTGLESTIAQPEPEVRRIPKLSVFLERCRQLGLIGQSIAMFGGLVTTDVLADFYDHTYQALDVRIDPSIRPIQATESVAVDLTGLAA